MKRNRLLAMLLSLVMLLNMLPVTVWAESVPENFLFDISEGSVTIGSGTDSGTVKITYGDGTVKDNIDPLQPITVTGTTTANNITVTGSVSAVIVLKDLNIDVSSISITSAVNLNGAGECTIQLDGENILKAGNDRPGIYVPKNNQVTFTGTGSLDVTGAASWPGIGRMGNGNILIESGTIVSTGGSNASGIGGSWGYEGGTITINGGKIEATGGERAAGIGGGQNGSDDSFTTNITNEGGTTTDGNAIIFASSITDQSGKTDGTWSGVIFEGNDGKVYGSTVTPAEDFEIASGKKLLIPEGSTLNITGITAVNNGNVYVDGSLTGTFGGTGNVYYPLTVVNASADGDLTDYNSKTYGKAGGEIALSCATAPIGQSFGEWISTPTVTVSDSNTFTMPNSALTITAQYVNAPTYTVTIPAMVELGEEITILATGVNVVSGSQLEVKLTGTSEADNAFLLKTDEGAQLNYGITKDSTALSVGSTVLTVAGGIADNTGTANLSFVKQGNEAYAGAYKGTVTFTISVERG